jgi:hypothetical protein
MKTAVILLLSLILLEIALRAYNHFYPTFIFYDDSYNRFRGRPFASDWDFKLNAGGFKDLPFEEKKAGDFRVIGLGDSFAFGVVPYAFNYLTLLEERLNERFDRTVEVLNMGIPSIGPKDYLALLIREGLAFDPDLVLLSFFTGNDFKECEPDESRPLRTYSYVASLLYYLLHVRPEYRGIVPNPGSEYCDDCPGLAFEKYLGVIEERRFIYQAGSGRFLRLLDDACASLEKIRDICLGKGIPFLVVIIPDEYQVNPRLRDRLRRHLGPGTEESSPDITYPNRMLSQRLGAARIVHLDLTGPFREASKTDRLYRPLDSHWNIAGNRLAAGLIAGFVAPHIQQLGTGTDE